MNNAKHAHNKYIRLSPSKANRVLQLIRGKSYSDAILILEFLPYKASKIIKKTLESAYYNAQSNNNQKKQLAIIKQAYVNQGPTLKRFQARAQGRAFSIKKRTCHITITVENQNIY